MPEIHEARPLFRPADAGVRFLPEGPCAVGDGVFSWVGIQHGADAQTGSLHRFNMQTGQDERFDLPGRPGFAFPATDGRSWVVGLEREIGLFDTESRRWSPFCGPVDAAVTETIINDATLCEDGLIFGCKHLRFTEKKAGLYFWRGSDRRLFRLRSDQICSNGKKVVARDGGLELLDIDSPTKTVVAYTFDPAEGVVGEARVVIDLREGPSFPDGMILTPDGASVIIAFYDPRDVEYGEARQYALKDGHLQQTWRTPGSPRVTCPALVPHAGGVSLVLTTAVEHMTAEEERKHPHAGCLFVAETTWPSVPPSPRFRWL
jgi:sugar lactone lactonase YvrE